MIVDKNSYLNVYIVEGGKRITPQATQRIFTHGWDGRMRWGEERRRNQAIINLIKKEAILIQYDKEKNKRDRERREHIHELDPEVRAAGVEVSGPPAADLLPRRGVQPP